MWFSFGDIQSPFANSELQKFVSCFSDWPYNNFVCEFWQPWHFTITNLNLRMFGGGGVLLWCSRCFGVFILVRCRGALDTSTPSHSPTSELNGHVFCIVWEVFSPWTRFIYFLSLLVNDCHNNHFPPSQLYYKTHNHTYQQAISFQQM